jgi:phosphoglycolate phosphatase-like HAD superfamily hydrolase
MRDDVTSLLHAADHVLIAFDGPLCTVFDPSAARATAERLRLLLGPDLPRKVARTNDPFEVLRYAITCGENTAYVLERQLTRLEGEAMSVRVPTDGAIEAVHGLHDTGHTVTAIGNTSTEVIRGFLGLHGLWNEVRRISARGSSRTAKLLPEPFLLDEAIEALGTEARRCVFIGTSAQDAEAGRAAGVPMLGCGRDFPRKQAAVVVESMTELATARDLINWSVR